MPTLTVRIAGVDVTDKVKTGEDRRTVKLALALGSESSAQVMVGDPEDALTGFRPDDDDEFEIAHDDGGSPDARIFRGHITEIHEGPYDPEGDTGVLSLVSAKAMRAITEQIQDVSLSIADGTTRKAALQSLVDDYLTDAGIVLDPSITNGNALPALEFDGVTPKAFLDRLAEITGEVWRLTPDDVLEMFAVGDKPAGFSLDESNAGSVTVRRSRSRFCNRVVLKAGGNTVVAKSETFTGDGSEREFPFTYDVAGTAHPTGPHPSIFVDGVYKHVAQYVASDPQLFEWVFDYATMTLTQLAEAPPGVTNDPVPNGVSIVTQEYPAQFPITVVVEDAASIAAVGLWSKTFRRQDIFDFATAQEVAAGLLATGLTFPREVSLMTQAGFALPGCTVDLDFPKRLVSGTWLIARADIADFEGETLEYTYTLQSGDRLLPSSTDTLRDRLSGAPSEGSVVAPTPSVSVSLPQLQQQIDNKLWHPLARKFGYLQTFPTSTTSVSGVSSSDNPNAAVALDGTGTSNILAETGFMGRRFTTGSSINNAVGLLTPDNIFPTITDPLVEWLIRTGPALGSIDIEIGCTRSGFASVSGSEFGIRYISGTDSGWVGFTQNSSKSLTSVLSAIAVDTVYRLRMRVAEAGTAIYFSVNGGTEEVLTTDLPTTSEELFLHLRIVTKETVAKSIDFAAAYWEYMAYRYDHAPVIR